MTTSHLDRPDQHRRTGYRHPNGDINRAWTHAFLICSSTTTRLPRGHDAACQTCRGPKPFWMSATHNTWHPILWPWGRAPGRWHDSTHFDRRSRPGRAQGPHTPIKLQTESDRCMRNRKSRGVNPGSGQHASRYPVARLGPLRFSCARNKPATTQSLSTPKSCPAQRQPRRRLPGVPGRRKLHLERSTRG